MTDEVRKVTLQVRKPHGADPGKVFIGHYVVVENNVILCDEDGKPIGSASKRTLAPGEDAHLVACRLLRNHASKARGSSSDFNRPLQYQKLVY
jgi:hypothetical protein